MLQLISTICLVLIALPVITTLACWAISGAIMVLISPLLLLDRLTGKGKK